MGQLEKGCIMGCIIGTTIGFASGLGVAAGTAGGGTSDARIFERENQPVVMRVYKKGADTILVQDNPCDQTHYVALDSYLGTILDPQKREIEEVNIKKLVGW